MSSKAHHHKQHGSAVSAHHHSKKRAGSHRGEAASLDPQTHPERSASGLVNEDRNAEDCGMQLIEKTVDLRGSQILNIDSYEAIKWYRRMMALITLFAWVGFVLYVIALIMPKWAMISFRNAEGYDVSVELGVFGEWRTMAKRSRVLKVEWFSHFPEPPENVIRLNLPELNHYYRAQAVMGIIAIVLFLATNLLAVYTFFHHRYIFKRLAAGLYMIVGFAILATTEVLTNSVKAWNKEAAEKTIADDFGYENHLEIGWSTRLAQTAMIIAFIAAVIFMLGSHKQKGDKAATTDLEIEDRPIHVGRL